MAALERISIAAIEHSRGSRRPAGSRGGRDRSASGRRSCFAALATWWATWLASKTDKVGIGIGIAWAFTRSAFILAVSAPGHRRDVGRALPARSRRAGEAANETWHDVARTAGAAPEGDDRGRSPDREQASSGQPIRYEGEYVDIDIKGWCGRTGGAIAPTYTAARCRRDVPMAGDVADG